MSLSKLNIKYITLFILIVVSLVYFGKLAKKEYKKYQKHHQLQQEVQQALITGKYDDLKIIISDRMKKEFSKLPVGASFKKPKDIKKLILLNFSGGVGDEFTSIRLQEAATNLGWEAIVIGHLPPAGLVLSKDQFNIMATKIIQPDFIISQCIVGYEGSPENYLVINIMTDFKEKTLDTFFDKGKDYAGFLYSSNDPDNLKIINDHFKKRGREIPYTVFFHSVPEKYGKFEKLTRDKITICGDRWDPRRSSEQFSYLFKKLDEDGIAQFYGPDKSWKDYESSYKGFLPYDNDKYFSELKSNGIYLVVHSNFHYDTNIPTSRIFEAAASSNVIISDDIKFVRETFGDAVLYFDPTASGEELYKQIRQHYDWIQQNPEKAQELAKRVNQIFQKYSLEKQLLKLEKLHDKVIENKNKN